MDLSKKNHDELQFQLWTIINLGKPPLRRNAEHTCFLNTERLKFKRRGYFYACFLGPRNLTAKGNKKQEDMCYSKIYADCNPLKVERQIKTENMWDTCFYPLKGW